MSNNKWNKNALGYGEKTNSSLNDGWNKNALKYDSKNTFLKEKEIEIQKKLSSNQPTIPTTLGQEIKTNIFYLRILLELTF